MVKIAIGLSVKSSCSFVCITILHFVDFTRIYLLNSIVDFKCFKLSVQFPYLVIMRIFDMMNCFGRFMLRIF